MGVRRPASICLLALIVSAPLSASVLKVPAEHPTIKAAVKAARGGDTILVADGLYFEKNIVVDKDIAIRAEHLYGAYVYGTRSLWESLFVVRAKAEIAGFVLLNSDVGIMQRGSPDVAWRGYDLWIQNMRASAILIDDMWSTVGSADLYNVVVSGCGIGIGTNDAGDVRVRRAIAVGCRYGFAGSNHRSFLVERSAVWNCGLNVQTDVNAERPANNNEIALRDVVDLDGTNSGLVPDNPVAALWSILDHVTAPYTTPQDDARRRALVTYLGSEASLARGDLGRALAGFETTADLGRRCGFPFIVLRAIHGSAIIRGQQGGETAALVDLKRAVQEIDALYRDIPFKFFQTEFFADKIGIYEALLAALSDAESREPGRGYAREALLYSEGLKAGGLAERLLARALKLPGASPAGGENGVAAVRREIGLLQARLGLGDIGPEERQSALEKLEDAEDEYKSLLVRELKGSLLFPGDGTLKRGNDRPDLQIGPDTAVLEYFLGDKAAFGFWANRDDVAMVRLPDAASVETMAVDYVSFLTLEGREAFLGGPGGRKLYDTLVGPFASRLRAGIRKLIIIPDGALAALPFEALVGPGGRFLVEDFEVSYAPSIRCRDLLASRRPSAKADRDLFLYADPGAGGRTVFLAQAVRPVTPLAFIGREASAVARRFVKERSNVVIAGNGPVISTSLLDVARARVVHFAVHGYFDNDHWWRSALLVGPGAIGQPDGLLQPFDILGGDFVADLVVLSACETGNGRQERGEGPMGFASAFLAAGAKAVVASLWAIPDQSAAVFMDKFYGRWTSGGDAQSALRAAKVDMLRSRYSHPRHWAAFVLLGREDALAAAR